MEKPSTTDPDANSSKSGPPTLNIPTEVCEHIIDMLYSTYPSDTVKDLATLHNCALVCRAWRVRSQKTLFYRVQLSDNTSLRQLSAILDTGRHLRDYVYEVELTGYHLHTTTSIFALFPVVFAQKLPNLKQIYVAHLSESSAKWYPRKSDPPKFKPLQYIPLHPRFPAFLSSFTSVSVLYLAWTTFRSFNEFARMIHGLPNLEALSCDSIRWITPGADFMPGQPDWMAARSAIPPPFAPKIRRLHLTDIAEFGVEKLTRTRGRHLAGLDLTIPLSVVVDKQDNGGAVVDLNSCTGLRRLRLLLTSKFSMDKDAAPVKALLASWTPRHPNSLLNLDPYIVRRFTRDRFADALRGLGTVLEASLRTLQQPPPSPASVDSEGESQTLPCTLSVRIYDWEAKKDWWSAHLDSCFPTWARLRQIGMDFRTPTHKGFEWAPAEKAFPSETNLPSAAEGENHVKLGPACGSKEDLPSTVFPSV